MANQGMLVISNNAPPKESEFADWCSGQFVPAMAQVPGVNEAWLYRSPEHQPKYLQVYYLSSLDVLKQPEYLRLRGWGQGADPVAQRMLASTPNFTVGAYEHLFTLPTGAPDLSRANSVLLISLALRFPEIAAEWEDWYHTEHVPNLSSAPGVVRGCRYRLVSNLENQGSPLQLVAFYATESLDIFTSDGWRRGARTPWTARMERHHTIVLRALYNRMVLRCAAKA